MSHPADQYLFMMSITIVRRGNDNEFTMTEEKYEGIGQVVETPAGGLLLRDMRALPIRIFAPGEWIDMRVTDAVPVTPTEVQQHLMRESSGGSQA